MLRVFGKSSVRECAGAIEVPKADLNGSGISCFLFVYVLLAARFQNAGLHLDIVPKNIRSILV